MAATPPLLAWLSVREREAEGILLQRTFDLVVHDLRSLCVCVFDSGLLREDFMAMKSSHS